jgi:23S rRNA (guanosine2251-2'-O)-methyltransferase
VSPKGANPGGRGAKKGGGGSGKGGRGSDKAGSGKAGSAKGGGSGQRRLGARPHPQNPRVAPLAGKGHGLGGEQIEGRRPVREALRARRRKVGEIWMAGDLEPAPILDEIMELARRAGVPVRTTPKLDSLARTDASQGVVARADPLPVAVDDDLLADPAAFLLALEGVTDPRNLGAILRSAEAAGVTGLFLPRRRAVHVTAAVSKAAAGAVEHVPIALVPGIPATLNRASRAGVWTIGLDERGDQSLFDLDFGPEPLAIVLGAEGQGLSRLARQRCDVVVRIPMLGRLESLNVAAAATLACFEVARRRTRRVTGE